MFLLYEADPHYQILNRYKLIRESSLTIIHPPIFMLSFSALMFLFGVGVVVSMLPLDPPSPFTTLGIKLQYPALYALPQPVGVCVRGGDFRLCHSRQKFHQQSKQECKKRATNQR
ncbi:hypothetical protein QQF64_030164 [Cirrhinus molitorella]|uniref:Uncharacterized protein n=1 Tax=Cirrhinus molitorella TaxID=172907 RepID=A0ABR3N2V0_9TELE